jgi:hypothetical protein
MSNDSKADMKKLLKKYLRKKIMESDKKYNEHKIKQGRPNSLTINKCLDAIFYVLIEGVSWEIASKLATKTTKYRSTIHRRYMNWVKRGIIAETYDEITTNYLETHQIDEVHIDSTDIQNKNMICSETHKSFKLSKQALRVTIIGDNDGAPLDYVTHPAKQPDNVLGYDMLIHTNLKFNKQTKLYADKGYYMTDAKKEEILQRTNLQSVVPKKRYKKRTYKTKNYIPKRKRVRHSKQMKEGLKRRVKIEHINSVLHRSYKRLDKLFDKKLTSFCSFINLAISMILLNKQNDSG